MSTEPNADDWLMAGKVLYWLQQGVKRRNKGKSPPKVFGATQRMALDALIAISSRRYNVTVVTENYDDFNAINYYCKFKLMKGSEFLERFEEKLKRGYRPASFIYSSILSTLRATAASQATVVFQTDPLPFNYELRN